MWNILFLSKTPVIRIGTREGKWLNSMKKAAVFLLALLVIACFSSCVDFTKYPSGVFTSDYPYFYYDSSAQGDYSAQIDYHGKRTDANLYLFGEGFDVDISEIQYDEEGMPYIDGEGLIANGLWNLDHDGNLILKFNNGTILILNKQ